MLQIEGIFLRANRRSALMLGCWFGFMQLPRMRKSLVFR